MRGIIDVLILLGSLGFVAGILRRIIAFPDIFALNPTAYLKFSVMCLLLAVALAARQFAFKEK